MGPLIRKGTLSKWGVGLTLSVRKLDALPAKQVGVDRPAKPLNLYIRWEKAENQWKPSEVCATAYMPAVTDPFCVRQDVWMYWLKRLSRIEGLSRACQ